MCSRLFSSSSSSPKSISLAEFTPELIRNFCIIAHVDHGKSTLADRLLEYTGMIAKGEHNAQVLDKLSVERARGITVKAQTAAMMCTFDEQTYLLNLIDTPGHVDFSFEVKRSLVACDNALLLVDACKGVMAQTLATFHLANSRGLRVIPIINKIDLPNANVIKVKEQLTNLLGIEPRDVLTVSAKKGTQIEDVITTLILDGKIPSLPKPQSVDEAFCVVVDSEHHQFRGTVVTVLVRSGALTVGMDLRTLRSSDRTYKVKELGIFSPNEQPCDALYAGQVGYVAMGIRSPAEVITGDVFYRGDEKPVAEHYVEPIKPMVFAGLYPVSHSADHLNLRIALEKLCLNDPSIECSIENHPALGAGWRLGFLGLLHMDVIRQRLEEEYGANLILTAPSVSYRVKLRGKKNMHGDEWITVHNALFPDDVVEAYEEMHVRGSVLVPEAFLSGVLKLCLGRRGVLLGQECVDKTRLHLSFDFPLREVILDFNDQLKTVSSGFACFEFVETGWQPAELTRLSVQMNGKPVEELTQLVPKAGFLSRARALADALANEIPRQQFLIRIQVFAGSRSYARADIKPYRKDVTAKLAVVVANEIPRQQFLIRIQVFAGSRSYARADIKPYRKDVTAKLHAADPSRRNKLLQRQAEGKKRLRMIGQISVPRDVFINVLKKSI